jgi:hypothetical protein
MGTVYGMVNGSKVLFTARHCNAHDLNGGWVKDPIGNSLGSWANNTGSSTAYNNIGQYDMSFIWLVAGSWPNGGAGYPNEIYRGAVSGTDYWTNTPKWSSPTFDNLDNILGDTIHRNQQEVAGGTKPYIDGTVSVNVGDSFVNTNLQSDNCSGTGIDSGTPWVVAGISETFGVGTSSWGTPYCYPNGVGPLARYDVVANWRQAILDLNSWVVTNYGSGNGGAYFCANAACT